jgi:hypothetical protein
MDRRHHIERQQEGTAKPTGNARKAGPRPWEMEKYIYQEEPRDEKGSSHSDPRLELAQQNHSLHQDSHVIPHDGDPEQIHPAFGLGATSDLYARAFTTSDLGTLAGCRDSREVTISFKDRNGPKFDNMVFQETCHGEHKVEEGYA